MINVVFCLDAAFWNPLLVTIASLLTTGRDSRFRLFVVSSSPVPEKERARLAALLDRANNATAEIIVFDDTTAYGHLPVHGHLSVATYLRLFMTEFLPQTLDRVLYLDSDVMVLSDLRPLWDTELHGAYVGAALEPFDPVQRLPLGFSADDFYFNAGVMLVNLRRWRDENLLPVFLEFAERNRSKLYSPDQDILNSVFRGNVLDIGVKWNWQALFPRLTPVQLHISASQFKQYKHAPGIIHFTSRLKPWSWKWAPHYQKHYVKRMHDVAWRPRDRRWRHVGTKCRRILQRSLEWYLPAVARMLRSSRQRLRRH